MMDKQNLPEVRASVAVASLPISGQGSVFKEYCYRYGVVANLGLSLAFMLPPLAIALGWAAAGFIGASLGMLAGAKGLWFSLNNLAVFGNHKLKSELARQLQVDLAKVEFVGCIRPENNTFQAKFLTMRLETDDNVGFLELGEDALLVRMEEGSLRILRQSIRDVSWERFVELPYLRWIVLEYYEGSALRKLLLCSREGQTLQAAKEQSERLWQKIADWYTEPVVDWLEQERWGDLNGEIKS